MSWIKHLEITGIRSYDPTSPARMELPMPVALIVGHNGSGKTTIIECLRFACTGETPTSNKTAFVHDIKQCSGSEVRGQVKMKFLDKNNNEVVVSRALSTTQKKVTKVISTRTLDSAIKRQMDNGETMSIGLKNADMDMLVSRLLGVSKSVLNNVIFCHQEDNLWPLAEGSIVKKKFDDIFGQRRHAKVIDEMKKQCKQLKDELIIANTEMKYLEDNKNKVDEILEEIRQNEEKVEFSKKDVLQIEAKEAKLKTEGEVYADVVKRMEDLNRVLDSIKTKVKAIQCNRDELSDKITNPMSESKQELENMLESFQNDLKSKKLEEGRATRRLQTVVRELERAQDTSQQNAVQLAQAKEQSDAAKKAQQEYNEKLNTTATEMEDSSKELLGSRIKVPTDENILHWLELNLDKAKDLQDKWLDEETSKSREMEQQIDRLKKDVNISEGELHAKQENKKKLKEEMDKLRTEIARTKQNEVKISQLKKDLKDAGDEVDRFSATSRLHEIVKKVDEKRKEMKEVAEKQAKLSGELEILNMENEARQRKERTEGSIRDKEAEVEGLTSKHRSNITVYLKDVPRPQSFSSSIRNYLSHKQKEIEEQRGQLQKHQATLVRKESELAHTKKQHEEASRELREIKEKVQAVCSSTVSYDTEVQQAEAEFHQAKHSVASSTSFQYLYEKWREKIATTHTCPTCKSGLEEARAKEVIKAMTTKIERAPRALEEKKVKEKAAEKKFFALQSVRTYHERMTALEGNKIPSLTKAMITLSTEIEEERENVEDIEDAMAALSAEEATVKDMEQDFVTIDRVQSEVVDLKNQLVQISARLVSSYDKSLTEALEEQSQLQDKYNILQSEYERLDESKRKSEDKKSVLQQKFNSIQSEMLTLTGSAQDILYMEERQKEKARDIHQISKKETEINNVLAVANGDLEKAQEKLAVHKKAIDKLQKQKSDLILKLSNGLTLLRAAYKDICSKASNINLASLEEAMENGVAKVKELKAEKKLLEDEIRTLQRDVSGWEIRKRDITDTLQVLKMDEDIAKLMNEKADTKKQIASLPGGEKAREKLAELNENLDALSVQKATLEGRSRGFTDLILKLRQDLASDLFKDSHEKLRQQQILVTVTDSALRDVTCYMKAYERAIMRFHEEKMSHINKCLMDLWTEIYKGNDIDNIVIKTDEELDENSTSKRKTCNYKVMKIRGGVISDMRYQSSAGQRVLASLLIRLALAETFCDQCGIIALDEPTTNLDKENRISLAEALKRFIERKQDKGCFQLIVITHDEAFVKLLGGKEYMDCYFKVEKDLCGISSISKISI